MKIDIINSQVYDNPYQKLLYTAIGSKYRIASGSLAKAIVQQLLTKRSIYHIHWEESLFSRCTTTSQAIRVRSEYVKTLHHYVAAGGKVVWTLHNIKPHECKFVQTLFSLRKDLAALSHRILVHNSAALTVLQAQTGLTDLSKVMVIPHPAYFDIYESAEQTITLGGQSPTNPRTLLHFGLIRAYKGIPDLVRKLPKEFMSAHRVELHICGKPLRADTFLDALLAETRDRPEIRYSLRSIPPDRVAALLRSHAGLILPYHKVLTSGVAVLGLTLGVPTIAPNTPAMRELFPESSHHLLFNPRSTSDLRRAVVALVEMPEEMRKRLAHDYIQKALLHRPQIVSATLGKVYDGLLGLPAGSESQSSLWTDIFSRDELISLRIAKLVMMGTPTAQSGVTSQFRLSLETGTMATRASKAAAAARSNEQLALELVKATLVGSVRTGISDELILNGVKDANKLTLERARLDGAYAVRLYIDILGRLDRLSSLKQPAATDEN
ncbi:glycosyltransferase [Bordetella genomosp. 4]|uniref:glycosyltransferase n=1 Tax=Bordetella genomosp. 4 TaxID=463044 RepID=UPI000B9EB57B|nr:glycosyltransferase [Bordetella genomosp. 4]OZI48362.1 hypothetical protein CAL21_10880 [Bordetella genomosp. 4]